MLEGSFRGEWVEKVTVNTNQGPPLKPESSGPCHMKTHHCIETSHPVRDDVVGGNDIYIYLMISSDM